MYLPAEWELQSCVQLTMPHLGTDWAPMLDDVLHCYCDIAHAISRYEPLIVVCEDMNLAKNLLSGLDNVTYVECPTNDTWARDHGFITCVNQGSLAYKDFQFNGWGLKFAANCDNLINKRLWSSGIFQGRYENHNDFVLEGGSIESDGKGTIMTTSSCLLGANRNGIFNKIDAEIKLKHHLGAERVLWLDHGHLIGDDTDGHIDTLARFCDTDTIAYVDCADKDDPHFEALQQMQEELTSFRTAEGNPYKLVGLPLPAPIYDEGQRLPATYANFLIINDAVIYPTYGQKENDRIAGERIQGLFPDRTVVGVDCRVLIRQNGSLHCCTMQYPSPAIAQGNQ